MRLTVLGRAVEEDYLVDGQDSASFNDIYGFLAKQKVVRITDPRAKFNPFAPNSRLSITNWRNGELTEFDDSGNITFAGGINSAGYAFTRAARITRITGRDNLGILKDAFVEELLLKSENSISTQYSADGNYAAGYTGLIDLNNTGSPIDVEVGDIISFNPSAVPRYQVTEVSAGSPTPSIRVDRALEFAVSDTTILRIMAPVIDTGPGFLKRALIAAGMGNRLDNSFDALDLEDSLGSLFIRIFLRNENKVKLADHITKLMDMADIFLTISANNVFSVSRGLQYDGTKIKQAVTDSEIILDIDHDHNPSKLYWAYDCLYYDAGKISKATNTVSEAVLNRWAATARWQPVPASGSSPRDYQYLYANAICANFMGQRKILYNGHPRPYFKCQLARCPDGHPSRPYRFTLGTRVLLNHDFGGGKRMVNEPAAVTQYVFDQSSQIYTEVIFELTNKYYPLLPVP